MVPEPDAVECPNCGKDLTYYERDEYDCKWCEWRANGDSDGHSGDDGYGRKWKTCRGCNRRLKDGRIIASAANENDDEEDHVIRDCPGNSESDAEEDGRLNMNNIGTNEMVQLCIEHEHDAEEANMIEL